MPTVSVIIPAFNEEKNIERLLVSIKKQKYKRIEIVVVDDASTDNTSTIAREYTDKVFQRKHAERSIQRNFGAKKSSGDYLLFLDADMELTENVVGDCIEFMKGSSFGAITIAERTISNTFTGKVRAFEREMYMGDPTVEVARFFPKKIFFEFNGYDPSLTGPEDYDLPYRISQKYKTGRVNSYILHHEEGVGLVRLLKKKYYYAAKGAIYAKKHPELIKTQGNLLFRKAYIKNWKKFVKNPILGISFIVIRILETASAVLGYISAVGIGGFLRACLKMFK